MKSKDVKAAQQRWEAEQAGASRAPKMTPLMRAVVILCSTLGMLLFGYRMYLRHYADDAAPRTQYVRPYLGYSLGARLEQHMVLAVAGKMGPGTM